MDTVVNQETDLPRPKPRPDTPREDEAVAIEEVSRLGLTPKPEPKDPGHDFQPGPDSSFGQDCEDGRDETA
jgi:hypothetical protein